MTDSAPTPGSASNPADWLAHHGEALFRYAALRLGDAATAEDVLQETLVAALRARDTFKGQSTERTWLIGILRNKILDHIRAAARRRTREAPQGTAERALESEFTEKGLWARGPAKWGADPDELLHDEERRATLLACVNALPQPHRDAIVLRELEGLPTEEICKLLSVTATNLWTILHRARAMLRRCIEQKRLGSG